MDLVIVHIVEQIQELGLWGLKKDKEIENIVHIENINICLLHSLLDKKNSVCAENELDKKMSKIMTQISILILLSWIFIRHSLCIPNYSQNSLKYLLQNGEETEISIQPIQIRHTYKVLWGFIFKFNNLLYISWYFAIL